MPKQTQRKPSAKAPERRPASEPGIARRAVNAASVAIARNPTLVGGSTAFLVAMFYVSANALWYQPHLHGSAFFQTREVESRQLPPMPEEEEVSRGNPAVSGVQSALRDLRLYAGENTGEIDEQTRTAIATYQKIVGLDVTGDVDERLLDHLGLRESTASIAPVPQPRATGQDQISERILAASAADEVGDGDRLKRIQSGLRAFGNDEVTVDGLMGAKTRAGIEEFQRLFGLQVTGEPDAEVHAKMREIGLTD